MVMILLIIILVLNIVTLIGVGLIFFGGLPEIDKNMFIIRDQILNVITLVHTDLRERSLTDHEKKEILRILENLEREIENLEREIQSLEESIDRLSNNI